MALWLEKNFFWQGGSVGALKGEGGSVGAMTESKHVNVEGEILGYSA